MKKMLVIPQISCKSSDGKILLKKDSGMNFLINMLKPIIDKICIHYAFPFMIEDTDFNSFVELKEVLGTDYVHYCNHRFTNAKTERMNFDVAFFENIKKLNDYDYIFVAEPTQVLNVKAIFPEAKIITYNSWLAFKNMPEIHLRQFEGMCAADLCLVNSNYAKYEILRKYRNFNEIQSLNIEKLPPSYFSGYEVYNAKTLKKNKLGIIYNHRLSSDQYYAKAFDNLHKVLDIVEKTIGVENMPTVYLTNPSGKENYTLKSYMQVIDLESQEKYYEFLKSKNVFIHLNTFFESQGMWSMSTVECAIAGNICLLPKKYGYAEIFSDKYAGYCDNIEEMARKLLCCLQNEFPKQSHNDERNMLINYSGKRIGEQLIKLLENNCSKNAMIVEKPWGKYAIIEKSKNHWSKILYINKDASLSRQKHKYREEIWHILGGNCIVDINGKSKICGKGSIVEINRNDVHKVMTSVGCKILEIADGDLVHECDIERMSDKYGRL